MFEKPKSLAELSEYESASLVMYLVGTWDGSGPNPGYSWEEFFSDEDLGEVPSWLDPWIASFAVEALVTLNHAADTRRVLYLIRDRNRNEIGVFASNADKSVYRLGDVCYSGDMLTAEILWPFVEGFLNRNEEAIDMNFQVWDPEIIPCEKVRAFLEEKLGQASPAAEIDADVTRHLQKIYSDQTP